MINLKCSIRLLAAGVIVGSALFSYSLFAQDMSGTEILTKCESVINAPKDSDILAQLILIDKDGNQKERKLTMLQKGDEMRFVRFLSPADQKGIGFLRLAEEIQYIYLPAFKKVRRIASHIKNQSFAGTDFTYDDIGTLKYSEDYDTKLVETNAEFYVLELTPKSGMKKDYSKLKFWVQKDNYYLVKTEYFDKGFNLWKVMDQRKISKVNGYWTAQEVEMKDLKTNHRTLMHTSEIKFDKGLSDELFTERNLEKF